MRLQYTEIVGDNVIFELPNKTLEFVIFSPRQTIWYLKSVISGNANDAIFKALSIQDKSSYVSHITKIVGLGADNRYGPFPEVASREELIKVIQALDAECVRQFGNRLSKGTSITSTLELFPRKEHYKLKFNI